MKPELENLLKHQHTMYLEWGEPYKACDAGGGDLHGHVSHRATVHDCINMSRYNAMAHNDDDGSMSDEDLLLDFMAVHWAGPAIDPSMTYERACEIMDNILLTSPHTVDDSMHDDAYWIMEQEIPESSEESLILRLLQYNYDSDATWKEISDRVKELIKILAGTTFTGTKDGNVSQSYT